MGNEQNKTITVISKEWLNIKRISIKYSSYVKYKNIIETHIIPYFENISVNKIDEMSIANFIFNLEKEKKLSSSQLHSIKNVLKSIYVYGEKKYHFHHIDFQYVKISSHKMNCQVLSDDQEYVLTKYCMNTIDTTSLAILLGLYAGLRIGEVCALKWIDIDINERIIKVSKTIQRLKNDKENQSKTRLIISKPKTNSSTRYVVIPQILLEYIKKYQSIFHINDQNIFIVTQSTKLPDPRNIQRRFIKVCRKCQFETNFHILRHTYATNCIKYGVDVKTLSEMLGHANISTTLNRYVHPSLEFKKVEIDKLNKSSIVADYLNL